MWQPTRQYFVQVQRHVPRVKQARWGAQPQRVLSAHSASKARRSFRREAPLAAWGNSALKRQTCDHSRHTCRSQSTDVEEASSSGPLAGEDAASFDPSQQSTAKWTFFTAELAVVLAIMYAIWVSPDTGIATPLVHQLEAVFQNSHATITLILLGFAAIHSGMAYLRPSGEAAIGPRAYRVVFAAISLPLAVLAVVYFINHRYDGTALWNLRRAPYVHELVFALNFVSFYFLYPSTFNLLEVAAVDKPKLHLWETGVMRITRHPQMFGQALWCAAHTLWIGSTFTALTSALLMGHHLFGCWHGDVRLRRKYGQAFDEVAQRTSTVPFQAIIEGRQQLPSSYYKEFLRLPYLTITALTLGTYYAHPLMTWASDKLPW